MCLIEMLAVLSVSAQTQTKRCINKTRTYIIYIKYTQQKHIQSRIQLQTLFSIEPLYYRVYTIQHLPSISIHLQSFQ